MWILIIQRLAFDFLIDIVYFPLWWYTAGAKQVFLGVVHLVKEMNNRLSPGLWMRYIFVPMFGQRDIQGRLVSVFMRILNIIGRTFLLLVWIGVMILLFLLWIAFPPFVLYMFFASLV